MPTKHLKYGGSSMARTLACPAWASLAATLPQTEGRNAEAAEVGTCLHEVMEELIHVGSEARPSDYVGREFNGIKLTTDMWVEKIDPAIDAIEDLLGVFDVPPEKTMVEPFVEYIPDLAGGSIDVLGVSEDGKTAVVADYKFGYYPVSPFENAQLMFYALCADVDSQLLEVMAKVEYIVCAIIQPREDEATLSYWRFPANDLDAFEDDTITAINLSEQGTSDPVAGGHCTFCRSEAICPLKIKKARHAVRAPVDSLKDLGDNMALTYELESWIKAVRKLTQEQLDSDAPVEGFKLVAKRASRSWSDEDLATAKIKAMRGINGGEQYDMKLKSPAQMEKLFIAKGVDYEKIADYIQCVSSGTTIAKADDKRPEAQ